MLSKNIILIGLTIIVIAAIAGIFFWQLNKTRQPTLPSTLLPPEEEELPPPEEELITLTGTLKFTEIEGGCYFLETPDGKKYELLGIEEENFEKLLDQEITVKGEIREDMVSICMIGTIFEVKELISGEEKLDTSNWKTYRNAEYGFEVRYPDSLDLVFIRPVSWPPEISISPGNKFICEENGQVKTEIGYGKQFRETIEGNQYCVLDVSEGAMGTLYHHYQYTILKDNKLINLKLTLGFTSCGALYGIDDKFSQCQVEQVEFNPTLLVDQILSTFKFIK